MRLRRISYEHEIFARKLARLMYNRRESVHSTVFPMGFTAYNDLSLEYLARGCWSTNEQSS